MKKIGVPQIHLIPFDLGIVFYDVLSLDNTKNLLYANIFCEKVSQIVKNNGWKFQKLFSIKGNGEKSKTLSTISYDRNSFADQAICKVEIKDNLICYILSSGIGIFEFADLNSEALKNTDKSISNYSKALIANYQKKVSQSTILNKADFPDVFPKEEESMLEFRRICWKIVDESAKHKKIKKVRPFSGCEAYKSDGLSYVLTIYLLKSNELSTKEINHLLCSSFFSNVTNANKWESIDEKIKNSEPQQTSQAIEVTTGKIYPAWSAVAVETSAPFETIDNIRDNEDIVSLLKVEAYIQSRWFIADNSMDNVNKNATYSMENLQRIASFIEFCQAELENEISANMGTQQKNLLKPIVETSEVKQLYKSVIGQINTQRKIKEAHYQDKKRRNKFIVDLFLAVFSASTLYKAVIDLVNGSFNLTNWILFGIMMIVAIGTIVFNYKNK